MTTHIDFGNPGDGIVTISSAPDDLVVTARILRSSMNTLEEYIQKLDSGERFGVARYGDGEWGSILGKIEGTCYGDVVTPQLTEAIKNTLLNPKPYFYASLGEPWSAEVREWIRQNNVECQWAKKQVLEQASTDGKLLPFLQALRRRKVLIVGFDRLGPMCQHIPKSQLLVVDGPNCFDRFDVASMARQIADREDSDVVLFACGMASVVFIHELWDKTDATLIDIGSLFDPYVGHESRRGHRRPEFQEKVRRTLEALRNGDETEGSRRRVPETAQPRVASVRQSVAAGVAGAEAEDVAAVPGRDDDEDGTGAD